MTNRKMYLPVAIAFLSAMLFPTVVSTAEKSLSVSANKGAKNYYISAAGSDSNSGTSAEQAWGTFGKVSTFALGPGDRVLLEGGRVFCGTLELGSGCKGTKEQPVVVTSYGKGRAVIYGGDGDAVRIVGASCVNIENLSVIGSGPKTNNKGSGVLLRKSSDVNVDSIEASGFQHAGVFIDVCQDIRVTNVYAHDNGFAGILAGYFYNVKPDLEPSRNIYIGYCRALNNPGNPNVNTGVTGSGICLWFVQGGVIEYCEAAYNGWAMENPDDNGPVGIWLAFSRNVVVQYCISHDNRSSNGDGGGFDFDSGCHDCIMQYNYSYGNAGCGYLVCAYAETPDFGLSNCTLRFCISENDGQQNHKANLYVYNGANQKNIQIYNNVFYNEGGRGCVGSTPALPETFAFRNNLFIARGNASFMRSIGDAVFQGNAYWNPDGSGNWDGESTLEAWRLKGYERLDDAALGMFADPQLTALGRGEKLTDPKGIPKLKAYSVLEWSPLIGGGFDLHTQFGIDIGANDLYGHALPAKGPWCIGSNASSNPMKDWRDEYNGKTGEIPAEWKNLPNQLPAPLGPWTFRKDPTDQGLKDNWFAANANTADWISVRVPAFWAETKPAGNYQGYGWYRTTFAVPEDWKGKTLRLLFAGVDEQAWIYVNGKLVKEHSEKSEGKSFGVLWEEAFNAEVHPENLNYGKPNVLVVRVYNSIGNGGIWRPVFGCAVEK
jgi:hypothetical protein